MSRIGTWFPLRRAHHVYAHRRISRSGAKIFEPRRRRSSGFGRARQARHRKYRPTRSLAHDPPVVVVPINVLERDFSAATACELGRRRAVPLLLQLALARHNSHSMIIESTSSSMRVMVAIPSHASGEPKGRWLMIAQGGIAVRSMREVRADPQRLATCRLAPVRGLRFLSRCQRWSTCCSSQASTASRRYLT
jgi:hypothetical protein